MALPILIIILIFFNISIKNKALAQEESKKLFCMYLTRSAERQGEGNFQVDYINENHCSHLVYAYLGLGNDGKITSLNSVFDFEENSGRGTIRKFNNKKHYNTNLKTLVAVGGWDGSQNSRRYSDVFRNEENQKRFVSSAIDFLIKHNFNGLALHWTFPGINGGDPNSDKSTFTSVLKKLREEFSKRNFILIVICHGLNSQIDESYNVRDVAKQVDYIYVTSYDLYGEWSQHIGISSGLYLHPTETNKDLSANSVINSWLNRGAPPEKLIMGVPLFGRTFTLKYENQTTPGSFHVGPGLKTRHVQYAGLMSYMELCQRLNDDKWNVRWEDTQKNPYAFKDDQWVGYENERSLEIKSKYVIERNLAGIAVVFVEDDDFRGMCGEKYSRLKLINSYLRAGRETKYEYVLNVSVFKKNLEDLTTQCVYHSTEALNID